MKYACLLVVAAGCAVPASAQNLLNNGGFESDVFFDFSDLSNWNVFADNFGGASAINIGNFGSTTPFEGSRALEIVIEGGGGGIVGAVQEVFGVSTGTLYEFSVQARSNGSFTGGQAELKLEWYDSSGGLISDVQLNLTPDVLASDYSIQSLQSEAPVGAVRVNTVLVGIAFGDNLNVAIDSASLVVIPAPGAGLGLVLAGAAIAGRRRR